MLQLNIPMADAMECDWSWIKGYQDDTGTEILKLSKKWFYQVWVLDYNFYCAEKSTSHMICIAGPNATSS